MIHTLLDLIHLCQRQGRIPMTISVPVEWYMQLKYELEKMNVYMTTAAKIEGDLCIEGVKISMGTRAVLVEFRD